MNIREKVADYLEYCRFRKELDEKTLKAYRIDLKQYWEYFETNNPEKSEIEKYITELHKEYKQKTVKRKIASIKAFYNYLEEEEIIEVNPFHKIKTKFKEIVVLPRSIPRNEIEQLLNYMYALMNTCKKTDKFLLRDLAIVETFFATGARVYEISNIKAECVDLNTGLICFMGKGGKERYVQIGEPDIIELLKRYYMVYRDIIEKKGYFL